jgi:hypothetical protein
LREHVDNVLKGEVVPVLRGSFPHFYRKRGDHVDLATFQFSSAGGKFVVELSYADADRKNAPGQDETPPNKLRTYHTRKRLRLGSRTDNGDFWFVYDGSYPFGMAGSPEELAQAVVRQLRTQAEEWWREQYSED